MNFQQGLLLSKKYRVSRWVHMMWSCNVSKGQHIHVLRANLQERVTSECQTFDHVQRDVFHVHQQAAAFPGRGHEDTMTAAVQGVYHVLTAKIQFGSGAPEVYFGSVPPPCKHSDFHGVNLRLNM